MRARLLIAGDHEVVRQGLRGIFSRATDMEIVGEVTDGAEVGQFVRNISAELLIFDIGLPTGGGFAILESLRANGATIPTLVFSMYYGSRCADYARRFGAQGFIGNDADGVMLLRAARRILTGGVYFPQCRRADANTERANNPFLSLSRRENEVMQGLLHGLSLHDIAERMGIGSKSVSTYRSRLLEKLGVSNNIELTTLVIRHGYIFDDLF
ncbi:MAG TPA: response regulator transcription factor [Rhodocyclaceae bacterium]|nr:response regulator transcription factor [Rhodocyclaceae bacterium]